MELLIPLVLILVAEYVGDFIFQSRDMALNKSKDVKVLFQHLSYIALMLFGVFVGMWLGGLYLPFHLIILYILSYCMIHGIQDWYIWKGYAVIVSKRMEARALTRGIGCSPERLARTIKHFVDTKEYAEDKIFYDTIGLDRLLHVITLVVLWGVFFL